MHGLNYYYMNIMLVIKRILLNNSLDFAYIGIWMKAIFVAVIKAKYLGGKVFLMKNHLLSTVYICFKEKHTISSVLFCKSLNSFIHFCDWNLYGSFIKSFNNSSWKSLVHSLNPKTKLIWIVRTVNPLHVNMPSEYMLKYFVKIFFFFWKWYTGIWGWPENGRKICKR